MRSELARHAELAGPVDPTLLPVDRACLKLVKSFLTARLTNEFKRPKRPLTDRGDLKKNGVADVWITFVDALDNKMAFDLLKVRARREGARRRTIVVSTAAPPRSPAGRREPQDRGPD